MKKLILSMLCLLLALTPIASIAEAESNGGVMHLENDYIDVLIRGDNGRFSVRTKAGHPLRDGDNNKPLLFIQNEPDTSFTTFRIDGKDYIYGNDYGFLGSDGRFVYDPVSQGLTNQSVWRVKDVEIVQTITLFNQKDNPNLGNVKITYEATNRSDKPVELGSRILLDTTTGAQDASPFTLSGSTQYIRTETEIVNPEHYYWRAVDNEIAPKVMAYGFLQGWGNDAPDRIIAAHWEGISRTKWDYQVDPTLDFTSSRNKYGSADSAFALYWDPKTLAPGETRVYETFYGLGSFVTSLKQAKYASQIIAPKMLTVNEAKSGYLEEEFEIQLEIDNTTSKAEFLQDVVVELGLPAELELAQGEEAVKTIPAVGVNETVSVSWKVKPRPQYTYKAAQYWINIQTAGNEEVIQIGYVVLPALSGEPPEVQVHDVMPGKIYVHNEDKTAYVKGVGFDALKGSWDAVVELVRESDGTRFRVDNFTVTGDSRLSLDLGSALKGAAPQAGVYRLEILAGEFGSFSKTIEFTEDSRYKTRSYGILAVIKEGDAYRIVPVEGESQLAQLKKNNRTYLEIRGDVTEIQSDGSTTYHVKPGATINSIVRFEESKNVEAYIAVPSEMTVEKKRRDLFHSGDYVEVSGYGSLSIPNFPFAEGNFTIELVDGTEYKLGATDEGEPIVIEWDDFKWFTYVQQIDIFPIEIKFAELGDRSIAFGGSLKLNLGASPFKKKDDKSGDKNSGGSKSGGKNNKKDDDDEDNPFKASLNVDRVQFGINDENQFVFHGFKVEGEIGFPKEYIPGFQFGASAKLSIDTFERLFRAEVEVKVKVIEFSGIIGFGMTESWIPIPDTLELVVGNEPGIPLVPPPVVAYIVRGGAGVHNLYNSVMGNYNILPPVKLTGIIGIDIQKVLKADPVVWTFSPREISMEANFKIFEREYLKRVKLGAELWDDDYKIGFKLGASAEIDIEDIIVGEVWLFIAYDPNFWGKLGHVRLVGGGKVDIGIPEKIPLVGGWRFIGGTVEISSEEIFGEIRIIGIPIGVRYKWGDSAPTFTLSDEGEYGLLVQKVTDEEGNTQGYITYGTNVRLLSADELVEQGKSGRYAVLAANHEYKIEIGDMDHALLEFEYNGELPNLEIYDPQGNLYPLEKEVNYLVQEIPADVSDSGRLEQRIYVSIHDPQMGAWIVRSDKELGRKVYAVDDLPALKHVDVERKDSGVYEVTWNAENLKGNENVTLLLTQPGSNDYGRILVSAVGAAAGKATVTLPESLESGEYVIKAVLSEGESNLHSMDSATIIRHENANEPAQPTNVEVTPAGNGAFHVTWESADTPDGYMIEILDENGRPLDAGVIEVDGTAREAMIGGVVESPEGEQSGLIPGQTYVIGVSPFKATESGTLFGKRAVSAPIYLPEPDPAELAIAVAGEVHAAQDELGTYYVVNRQTVDLNIASDQTAEVLVSLDDGEDPETLPMGTSWTHAVTLQEGMNLIRFAAFNEQGDMSESSIRIQVDTLPPDLKIESPGPVYAAEDGIVLVRGATDPGSTVTVNGLPIEVDGTGSFEHEVSLDGYLSQTITIAARDAAGNTTEYIASAINETIDGIERIEIRKASQASVLSVGSAASGADAKIAELPIGGTIALEVVGYDRQGRAFKIDPASVEWDLLFGGDYGSISEDGKLRAVEEGEMVVKAAFALSNEYALEDVLIVRAVSDQQGGADTVNYDEWYVPASDPDAPGGGDAPSDQPPSGGTGGSGSGSGGSGSTAPANIDAMLEDMLRSIIGSAQGVEFITSVVLKSGEEIVVSISEHASLRIAPQPWDDGVGIGVGRVTDKSAYIYGTLEIIGDIYEFKTNKPVKFEQPPVLTIRFAMEDIADPDKAGIYWYNEQSGRWEYIGSSYNPLESSIAAGLPHFSKYTLIYNEAMRLFADIAGRWSEDIIYRLASAGIIDGVEQGGVYRFEPTRPVTRQEFAKLLVATAGKTAANAEVPDAYADAGDVSSWARPYVAAAATNGWIAGTPDEGGRVKLEPQRSITRAEAAVMFARMLGGVLEPAPVGAIGFKDDGRIPDWAAPSVASLKANGVLSGYPDGTFRPYDTITREEVAAMIRNIIDLLYNTGRTLQ